MVASYLVHHSYCATAEAFAKSTDQAVHEELASIKNRQSESAHISMIKNTSHLSSPSETIGTARPVLLVFTIRRRHLFEIKK